MSRACDRCRRASDAERTADPGAGGRCDACDRCLLHGLALELLAGHLETERSRIDDLLALPLDGLLGAVGAGRATALRDRLGRSDPAALRARAAAAGLHVVCGCSPGYPAPLRALAAPPAVLYATGPPAQLSALLESGTAAIVGARRAAPYGLETARALGRDLAGAGVTVVSGMALGIDGAAHDGALRAVAGDGHDWASPVAGEGHDAPADATLDATAASGATIAVLAGGADRPYPAAHGRMYARIRKLGMIVSELPPGVAPRRWMFPARNRIIAALSAITIVVQARARSGSLVTARHAAALGRIVGAVPGPVGSPLSDGPHQLIRDGAMLVGGAQDVLDALYGRGARSAAALRRSQLDPASAALLEAIAEGLDRGDAFARAGLGPAQGLAALSELELAGLVRRGAGGRLSVG